MNPVVQEANKWLRTPYHHQADVLGAGVDCAMLLIRVYHACGLIPDIDPRPYAPDWHLHRSEEVYLNSILKYADPVQEPLPGDIAAFKFGRCVSHCGIVVEWPVIIHAFRDERKVVYTDVSRSSRLQEHFIGWYRVRG